MPSYYTPGVYIEEVNSGPRPIEAVATAVAAFAGFAPAGPVGTATLITSWTQFVDTFGRRDDVTSRKDPYIKDAYLAHAIYGFFLNGGTRCYVVRVLPANAMKGLVAKAREISTAKPIAAQGVRPLLKVEPKQLPGSDQPSPSSEIEITLTRTPGTSPSDPLWTLRLSDGEQSEEYKNVSFTATGVSKKKGGQTAPPDPNAPPPDPNAPPIPNAPAVTTLDQINAESKLVKVDLADRNLATEAPAVGVYYISVPQPAPSALQKITADDILGDPLEHTGVAGLELADDVTMLCCPDLMSPLAYEGGVVDEERLKIVQLAMINHCELVGGRMALLDTPPKLKPQEAETWRVRSDRAGYDSMYAALYYPWITVANPHAGKKDEAPTVAVPPCGHVAGIYARNDSERGVHKAPANEVVRGALGTATEVSHGEQAGLNPNGVNCIRSFNGRGIRVWGARTLSSDPAWRFINVRRLFNMVEKSIERDTQWVVFEPNDPSLWSRVRRDVTAFLMTMWRDGMLFGDTPQQAFFVKCDEELNPPESRDLGRLIIEVGLAPVKPAEFVIFRFSQYTANAQ
jgi:uncharacterized protein